MSRRARQLYEFGDFKLDPAERLLLRGDDVIPLKSKVFDILVLMVQNSGRLLEKEWLLETLWPESFVEESNLNVNISALRKALGETPSDPRYIETVPKRGYRFVASVKEIVIAEEPSLIARQSAADKSDNVIESESEIAQADEAPVEAQTEAPNITNGDSTITSTIPVQKRPLVSAATFAAAVIALIAIVGAYLFITRAKNKDTGIAGVRTIAVLPFKTATSQEADIALGMGMADALIMRLSALQKLTVRPVSTVLKYSQSDQDPLEAGRALGVDVILTGLVQKDGKNIRISTQMLRVSDGATLWTEKFDDYFTNVFAVQDSISEKMAAALSIRLSGAEQQRLAKRYTENTEAYQLYLQGQYYHNRLVTDKALSLYLEAIEKDPEYPLPYTSIVSLYIGLANVGDNREEYIRKAREAADRAISLDPDLSDSYEALGTVYYVIDWDFANGEKAFQRSIELNPGNSNAHYSYATLLSRLGRHEEAFREMDLAIRFDPVSAYIHADYATLLTNARRYDEALDQTKKALELDPNFLSVYFPVARIYTAKSMYEEALEAQRKVMQNSTYKKPRWYAAYIYARAGKRAEAEKILRDDEETDSPSVWKPYFIAMSYAALGDRDRAFEWLEKAFAKRSVGLTSLKVEPEWDSLRSDPRFNDLIRRVGLSQ